MSAIRGFLLVLLVLVLSPVLLGAMALALKLLLGVLATAFIVVVIAVPFIVVLWIFGLLEEISTPT